MKMCGTLAEKSTVTCTALLRGAVPLETLLYDRRILSMVVRVHLHVRRGYIDLIAALLDAVIVRLFFVVRAIRVAIAAIIQRTVTHKAMLEGFIAFFMPLKMTDHLFLFNEYTGITV